MTQADQRLPTGSWGALYPAASLHRVVVSILLALTIFSVDAFGNLGVAVGVLHILPMVIIGDTGNRRWTMAAATFCVALTILAFLFTYGTVFHLQGVLRLLFSLAVAMVTTGLMLRRGNDRQLLLTQAQLLSSASDAILLCDREDRVQYWSEGATLLFGWSAAEALGRSAHELLETAFPVSFEATKQELLKTGHLRFEVKCRAKSGALVQTVCDWSLQRLHNGQISILQTNIDITARKSSEAALEASEIRFRTIFETLSVAILEHNFTDVKRELDRLQASGISNVSQYILENPAFVHHARSLVRITDVNQMALRMLEVPSKDQFFARLVDMLPESDHSFANCLVAINEGHPNFESEAIVRGRNGKLVNVLVSLNFPPPGQGLARVHGCLVDVTERVEMQTALDRTRAELEAKSRAAILGQISGTIVHEVSQPLAAIKTSAQAASRWLAKSPPDVCEVDAALNGVIQATELADEVVKRVRSLLGKARTERETVRIEDAISGAIRFKKNDLETHAIRLGLRSATSDPVIIGDRILIQQVLINVLTNSIQSLNQVPTPERELSISSDSNEREVVIDIEDTGIGLAQIDGTDPFRAFSSTKLDGMGIGLATSRSIVTAHNGLIAIRNRGEVRGAHVRITLPLQP